MLTNYMYFREQESEIQYYSHFINDMQKHVQWWLHSFFYFSAPFSLSLLLLVITSGIICYYWTENYGDVSGNIKLSSILQGLQVIRHGQ